MPPPKHDRSHDMRRSVSLSSKEHGFSFWYPAITTSILSSRSDCTTNFSVFTDSPKSRLIHHILPTPLLMLPKLLFAIALKSTLSPSFIFRACTFSISSRPLRSGKFYRDSPVKTSRRKKRRIQCPVGLLPQVLQHLSTHQNRPFL